MLTAYALTPAGPRPVPDAALADGDPRVGWIDLLEPTPAEDKTAERFLGASIPTREEAQEIEFSSRFYTEDGAQFLNLTLIVGADAGTPALTPLSFVLGKGRLATVRYAEFSAFRQFLARAAKDGESCGDAGGVMMTLLDAIIDRLADVIERTGTEIDRLNREIFERDLKGQPTTGKKRERRLERFLGEIGVQNDIVSKTRESLSSVERMVQYVAATGVGLATRKADGGQLKLMARDVHSLTDHLSFLSNRATFLLDATLGLIQVQQNEVISVLTVVATILLPPTLIGTLYGMNFKHMPELDWTFGYPLAIGVMVASAVVPFLVLKRRGWF